MKRAAALEIVLAYCRESGSAEVRAAAEVLATKPKGRTAGLSDRGLAFADWFRTTLPAAMQLSAGWREAWAKCFDEMLAHDGRTPEQIAAVCKWARTDDFWSRNFLTPLKLRQRKHGLQFFDRFAVAMKSVRGGSGPRRPQSRGYEIEPGAGPKAVSAMDLLQKGKA